MKEEEKKTREFLYVMKIKANAIHLLILIDCLM